MQGYLKMHTVESSQSSDVSKLPGESRKFTKRKESEKR